ncbi:MAG: hypothetical protein IMZ53_12900 [Thermoplasmata archaeon]|nr:hypothetical protein [Thermoplasmata archaeon]
MKKTLFILLFLFAPILKAQETLVDSYSESNYDTDLALYSSNRNDHGQSFVGSGIPLTSAKFYLKKVGSPTGNCSARLYVGAGGATLTDPVSATSGTINVSTLSTSITLVAFTFAGTFTPVNGTVYTITCHYEGGDVSNYIVVGADNSSPTDNGVCGYCNADRQWKTWTWDTIFYVYGTAPAGGTTKHDKPPIIWISQ